VGKHLDQTRKDTTCHVNNCRLSQKKKKKKKKGGGGGEDYF